MIAFDVDDNDLDTTKDDRGVEAEDEEANNEGAANREVEACHTREEKGQ